MPTYEYRCTVCGRMFERYQSFSDDPITVCPLPADGAALNGSTPVCSGEVRKVFSSVGISFKGSGFYRNDSRSEGRSTSKAPGDDSSGSSNSSTTSDSASKEPASSDSNSSKASKDSSSSTVGAASASG